MAEEYVVWFVIPASLPNRCCFPYVIQFDRPHHMSIVALRPAEKFSYGYQLLGTANVEIGHVEDEYIVDQMVWRCCSYGAPMYNMTPRFVSH
jgi:hypothetical protein